MMAVKTLGAGFREKFAVLPHLRILTGNCEKPLTLYRRVTMVIEFPVTFCLGQVD